MSLDYVFCRVKGVKGENLVFFSVKFGGSFVSVLLSVSFIPTLSLLYHSYIVSHQNVKVCLYFCLYTVNIENEGLQKDDWTQQKLYLRKGQKMRELQYGISLSRMSRKVEVICGGKGLFCNIYNFYWEHVCTLYNIFKASKMLLE